MQIGFIRIDRAYASEGGRGGTDERSDGREGGREGGEGRKGREGGRQKEGKINNDKEGKSSVRASERAKIERVGGREERWTKNGQTDRHRHRHRHRDTGTETEPELETERRQTKRCEGGTVKEERGRESERSSDRASKR